MTQAFDKVITGSIQPVFSHSNAVLSKINQSLKVSGTLLLDELIVSESFYTIASHLRTERSLRSDLTVNGFVNIDIHLEKVSLDQSQQWSGYIESSWADQVYIAHVIAKKPSYALGAGAKLSFKKKIKVSVFNSGTTQSMDYFCRRR